MSEKLFKGKRVIDGKWVESYCPLGEMHSGTVTYDFLSETVSEYARRKDINKHKIWENDIVRYFEVVENCDYNSPCFDMNKGTYEPRRTRHKVEFIAEVHFDEEMSAYVVNPIYCTGYINYVRRRLGEYPMEDIEVIGNIFDDKDIEVKSRPGLHIIQNENGGWEIIQK